MAGMYTIEELMAMVDKDVGVPLRRDFCDYEAGETQKLHQKYRKILYHERMELIRMKEGVKPLIRERLDFYMGRGQYTDGKVHDAKILKSEAMTYVEADQVVIDVNLLIAAQAEKVEYLRDILDEIRKRSFNLSNIINFLRFKHGLENLGQVIEMSNPDAGADD